MEASFYITPEAAAQWIAERREEHAGYYGTPAGRESISAGHVAPNAPHVIFHKTEGYITGSYTVRLGLTEGDGWAVWVRSSGSFLFVHFHGVVAEVVVGGWRQPIRELIPQYMRDAVIVWSGGVRTLGELPNDKRRDAVLGSVSYTRSQHEDLWPWETTT